MAATLVGVGRLSTRLRGHAPTPRASTRAATCPHRRRERRSTAPSRWSVRYSSAEAPLVASPVRLVTHPSRTARFFSPPLARLPRFHWSISLRRSVKKRVSLRGNCQFPCRRPALSADCSRLFSFLRYYFSRRARQEHVQHTQYNIMSLFVKK